MMTHTLMIIEVSQKQNYIFQSNKLKDNIMNSAIIAYVTSEEFFKTKCEGAGCYTADNIVYAGGGHTVLDFDDNTKAKEFAGIISKSILKEYPDMEVFIKTSTFDETDLNTDASTCLLELSKSLEKKKSIRRASFHIQTYGIEKLDPISNQPIIKGYKKVVPKQEDKINDELTSDIKGKGFTSTDAFENLGGSKNDSNFIAVIHIDGNGMGKRVEEFKNTIKKLEWKSYKEQLKKFSQAIDDDFKKAYKETVNKLANSIDKNNLTYSGNTYIDKDKNIQKIIPIRRIITAGDDICFVTEGRIGIECASEFLKMLSAQTNSVDNKKYSACAGVAIVHQKYPFFRAYELAEELCSTAKKVIKTKGLSEDACLIDWHIEFGEMGDSLDEIRKPYKDVTFRPYLVYGGTDKGEVLTYDSFQDLMSKLKDDEQSVAKGKLKELRPVLKRGEMETQNYLTSNLLDNLKGNKRGQLFDAIEMIDTYIKL